MSTLTPGAGPLGKALARKRNTALPAILLGAGLIVAVVFALLGFLESRRSEPVVILVRDIPFGQQITAEDLTTIMLPAHRPAQLAGFATPDAVAGAYAAVNLLAEAVVQPTMLQAEPPTQPVYPNGRALTPNMVPLPFGIASIGPLSDRDRVNIGFSDPAGSPEFCLQSRGAASGQAQVSPLAQQRPFACRLLSSVPVLYVDEAAGTAYLELTPYQAHTVRALQAAGLELWGERYGAGSASLPSLVRLDAGQVSREQLDAPIIPPAAE